MGIEMQPYFSISGNIGIGAGIQLQGGKITPTGNNQFETKDFACQGGNYDAGVSTPLGFDIGYSKGGTLRNEPHGPEAMNINNFGNNKDGYTTESTGLGKSVGPKFSLMYSNSKTWVHQ